MKIAAMQWNSVVALSRLGDMRFALIVLFSAVSFTSTELPAQEIEDRGDFELVILDGANDWQDSLAAYLYEYPELHEMINDLNGELNLAQDIEIILASWSDIKTMAGADLTGIEANALYDRGLTRNIYISYELIADIIELFEGDVSAWYPNLIQTVLHEIGHALIDINGINPPAQESAETVADQLAFFVMTEFYEDVESLLMVADHYRLRASLSDELHSQSEHLPDHARADAYLCWIDGKIQSDRGQAGQCASTYEALLDAWDDRLAYSWKQ